MKNKSINRRDFLKAATMTATALSLPMIIPSTALGRGTRPAPSNRVTLGIIGCGGMGTFTDMANFLNIPDVEILACCDVDARHRETAAKIVTDHEIQKLGRKESAVKQYNNFEDVLSRDDIDAVLIATPDHWHAGIAIAAAKAGKDIYGEKPLARTIKEGRDMVKAVTSAGVVFQMGTQTRSHAPVQDIIDLLHFGVIGTIRRIELNVPQYGGGDVRPVEEVPDYFDYERWLGPAPWRPYIPHRVHNNFRTVLDYSGGTITDHGTHRLDVSAWGGGVDHTGPVEIEGEAVYPKDGVFDAPTFAKFQMKYANGLQLFCETDPVVNKWGVTFYGDEGWIRVPMMAPLPHMPITASDPRILKIKVPPSKRIAYRSDNHWANFIECVKTRATPAQNIEIGHRSTSLCHLANIAMELNRPIRWDPDNEIFPDDAEANKKLDRPKREPWAKFFQV